MRFPNQLVQPWIEPGSRVLDLGCGDGRLLRQLHENIDIRGYGIENDDFNITASIDQGINIIEQDLDKGLSNFADNSFDTVIMTQTLQAVRYPHLVIDEMLRVGKQCIVAFPNFGNWRSRWYLNTQGKMPISKFMPYTWYDTPNIHFCTVADFETLCEQKNIDLVNRCFVDHMNNTGPLSKSWPNMFAVTAIYRITK
jgi:methionine biosynthesis protein MetW